MSPLLTSGGVRQRRPSMLWRSLAIIVCISQVAYTPSEGAAVGRPAATMKYQRDASLADVTYDSRQGDAADRVAMPAGGGRGWWGARVTSAATHPRLASSRPDGARRNSRTKRSSTLLSFQIPAIITSEHVKHRTDVRRILQRLLGAMAQIDNSG